MVHIEITQSPDVNVITNFKFHKNEVYFGSVHGDLLIDDQSLQASHLMIEIHDDEMLVHPQKGVEHYLINGKRATTIRKLRKGDTLGFGKTILKVLDFSLTPAQTKKIVLNEKLASLIDKNSPRLPVVEMLTRLMK